MGVPKTNTLPTFAYISKAFVAHSKETSLIPFTVLIFIDFNIVILQHPNGVPETNPSPSFAYISQDMAACSKCPHYCCNIFSNIFIVKAPNGVPETNPLPTLVYIS